MDKNEFINLIQGEKPYKELKELIKNKKAVELKGIVGSSVSAVCAGIYSDISKPNIFIADSKDEAAYLYNDLISLTGSKDIYFFPTGYKRSIEYGNEDPSGMVQRTAVLNALRSQESSKAFICTYPEAIVEKVIDINGFDENILTISSGESISQDFIKEMLDALGFAKVDFVYEPGQFSIRGGIVDIFSFSDNNPYRIDLFGDEVESIRIFDIGTQLSVNKVNKIEIIPDLKNFGEKKVSLLKFTGQFNLWVNNFEFLLKRFADVRVKFINELVNKDKDPESVDNYILTRNGFCEDISDNPLITFRSAYKERNPERTITFSTIPQPAFNKKFDILTDTINDGILKGYRTYILTENKVQIERLENVFSSAGRNNVQFSPFSITLHEGFTDHELKINFFTDHQIFDRYHKYTLHKEVKKSESLTIAELNSLKIGDYVVHIDHGVGRFGGLVKTTENGKTTEAIKLIYRDNDILFVSVHALHRISKYKDKDSEPPKIYKLGSGAWQKLKANTKRQVKDIAWELIALYAKKQQSKGFAFSHDSFLQHELEATFMYEDTPDQEKAIKAVKADMESDVPMDRLICGDVGFGKMEIAIRAAFKAACDSKQVAVLVPTTVLSLQHYRTFSKRFREFPVKVELLSRAKTSKQVNEIINDLKEGKIDIVIGTHKLLNKKVEFKDLGLLIIDEEQKFGVSSKEKLRQIKANVDTLTLTATPIPRTLQFSLMGSRDMSVIATPPPNRQPITTEIYTFDDDIIKEAVDFELSRNGQVYFIHNRVQDIISVRDRIKKICPEARIAVGHGQMKPDELEKIMMDFIYAEYDILLATTIVESGIDISNANTIIINNAQNFGLSDLHQLRGRVGRSNRKAYCYLITPPEESLSTDACRRLKAIEDFSDLGSGFNIAMQDLDIRGAGNILGGEQSGFIADIGFDTYHKILNEAILELREEELTKITGKDDKVYTEEQVFLTDSQIDTDREAFIPDSYVSNAAEKISLYRELDNITEEAVLQKFEGRLIDRFGEPPAPVKELYNIIRLRRLAMRLGFEKVIQKNGLLILHFIYNQKSVYYKSSIFKSILKFITEKNGNFLLKQHNNRLQITVKSIKDSVGAYGIMTEIAEAVERDNNESNN